jgi:hypothetical protein
MGMVRLAPRDIGLAASGSLWWCRIYMTENQPPRVRVRHSGRRLLLRLWMTLLCLAVVQADQAGVSFWVSGSYASFAASPLNPGWSLASSSYYDFGTSSVSRSFAIGKVIVAGETSRSAILTLQPTYTFGAPVLGATFSLGLGFGGGYNSVLVHATIIGNSHGVAKRDSIWGASDLAPVATLVWTKGSNNWMIYLTGNIPVGTYSANRLAAIGIGHGAIDGGFGYTWQNGKSPWEFSIVAGLTGNAENASSQYKNGLDSHFDFATSYAVSANVQMGVAGYIYYQLTGDSGSGAKLGPFLSKAGGVGPQISWNFNVGSQQWSANLRGYYEYWTERRTRGPVAFFTLSVPLSPPPKKRK